MSKVEADVYEVSVLPIDVKIPEITVKIIWCKNITSKQLSCSNQNNKEVILKAKADDSYNIDKLNVLKRWMPISNDDLYNILIRIKYDSNDNSIINIRISNGT